MNRRARRSNLKLGPSRPQHPARRPNTHHGEAQPRLDKVVRSRQSTLQKEPVGGWRARALQLVRDSNNGRCGSHTAQSRAMSAAQGCGSISHWSPSLVEPGFEWTVETQERVVALAGHSLDPVVLLTRGRLGGQNKRPLSRQHPNRW
jgi:hypothetical protein